MSFNSPLLSSLRKTDGQDTTPKSIQQLDDDFISRRRTPGPTDNLSSRGALFHGYPQRVVSSPSPHRPSPLGGLSSSFDVQQSYTPVPTHTPGSSKSLNLQPTTSIATPTSGRTNFRARLLAMQSNKNPSAVSTRTTPTLYTNDDNNTMSSTPSRMVPFVAPPSTASIHFSPAGGALFAQPPSLIPPPPPTDTLDNQIRENEQQQQQQEQQHGEGGNDEPAQRLAGDDHDDDIGNFLPLEQNSKGTKLRVNLSMMHQYHPQTYSGVSATAMSRSTARSSPLIVGRGRKAQGVGALGVITHQTQQPHSSFSDPPYPLFSASSSGEMKEMQSVKSSSQIQGGAATGSSTSDKITMNHDTLNLPTIENEEIGNSAAALQRHIRIRLPEFGLGEWQAPVACTASEIEERSKLQGTVKWSEDAQAVLEQLTRLRCAADGRLDDKMNTKQGEEEGREEEGRKRNKASARVCLPPPPPPVTDRLDRLKALREQANLVVIDTTR